MFGAAMADAVMMDAGMIGVEGVQQKMTDFIGLYMNFRCETEQDVRKCQEILTGFLFTFAVPLVAGAGKGGQNVH